jgi:hypothetical protein
MVIHNLNLVRMTALPPKANAPLVIDSNAVLASPASFEGLKPVAGRHRHLPQFGGRVQGEEPPSRATLNPRREPAGKFPPKEPFGLSARKAQNHRGILTPRVISVKRHIRPACLLSRPPVFLAGTSEAWFLFSKHPNRAEQPWHATPDTEYYEHMADASTLAPHGPMVHRNLHWGRTPN